MNQEIEIKHPVVLDLPIQLGTGWYLHFCNVKYFQNLMTELNITW
jgi:hypothetical protein